MTHALNLLAAFTLMSTTCGPRPETCSESPIVDVPTVKASPNDSTLRLVATESHWFVTGLGENVAGLVHQGQLFAVRIPIAGTTDHQPIAVMKAVGPSSGSTVQVASQCIAPGQELAEGLGILPLSSATDIKVGPCLARIVQTGMSTTGAAYVTLDVGEDLGVKAGDQFVLLGRPVTVDGHVPLGLDTEMDGRCQIPADPSDLKPTTARCMIVEPPHGTTELRNSFAAWERPRAPVR